MVSFEDWQKLDIRIASITKAEPVNGSDKLLRLEVDLGEQEPRQVVAGIAKSYNPDDLVGKQIVVLANLEPKFIMGMESQAILLAVSEEGGRPILLQPVSQVKLGSIVR